MYQCPFCDRQFSRFRQLQGHVMSQHRGEKVTAGETFVEGSQPIEQGKPPVNHLSYSEEQPRPQPEQPQFADPTAQQLYGLLSSIVPAPAAKRICDLVEQFPTKAEDPTKLDRFLRNEIAGRNLSYVPDIVELIFPGMPYDSSPMGSPMEANLNSTLRVMDALETRSRPGNEEAEHWKNKFQDERDQRFADIITRQNELLASFSSKLDSMQQQVLTARSAARDELRESGYTLSADFESKIIDAFSEGVGPGILGEIREARKAFTNLADKAMANPAMIGQGMQLGMEGGGILTPEESRRLAECQNAAAELREIVERKAAREAQAVTRVTFE